jgi:uncharacterized membrane protein
MTDYRGEVSITIAAPAEQVYAYLADFQRHPEWVKNLTTVTPVTPGRTGVGATFKTAEGPPPVGRWATVRMMTHFVAGVLGGAKPYSEATITALEPPRRIAWWAGVPKGTGFFNRAEWEFRLEPQGASTQLTQHYAWQPQNERAERMLSAAGPEGLRQAVAASLAQLKQKLEAGQ